MKKTYLGAVCGEAGSYGIVFRDFPGCASMGDTLEKVIEMGHEALQGHIEVMVDDGDAIPDPSIHELDAIVAWLDDPDEPIKEQWVGLFPVEVTIPAYPDSVDVPLNSTLVQRVEEIVRRNLDGIDLSESRQFIERATRRELDRRKKRA